MLERGVTVIKLLIGRLDTLVAVKALMSPIPLADKPIAVLSFVHSYTVPTIIEPVKSIVFTLSFAQTVWLEIGLTVGIGFTVKFSETGSLEQPLVNAITVMIDVTGIL